MNTNMFVAYILFLTCALTHFYAEVREYFNPLDQYKEKVTHLEERVQKERFKHLLTSYEFQDFRTHVATLLPEAIQKSGPGEKSYPLRTLASVVQKRVNEGLAITRANEIFESGKKLFREKKYDEAAERFQTVLEKHPYSAHIAEALFLSTESYFVLRKFDECVRLANKMLDVFPDNELTGYALLRLGKVYEFQERHEDAIEIYKTVMKVFPDRNLASLATAQLRAVEL